MPVESKQVNKFTKGLLGSFSESDIDSDYATFSLDVDSEFEQGSLRGIKGNYILNHEYGWELPRYARWRIRLTEPSHTQWHNTCFLLHAYNKIFLIHVSTDGAVPTDLQGYADEKNYTIVSIVYSSTNLATLASLISGQIKSLTTPLNLASASGITYYFTSIAFTETVAANDVREYILISSNFLGDIAIPESPIELTDINGTNYSTNVYTNGSISTARAFYPDKEIYEDVTTPKSWDNTRDGKFVKGNGMLPESNSDSNPLSYKFLKPINQVGEYNLFGISYNAKAVLLKNLGKENFSEIDLGSVASSPDTYDISAEQRNKNLYIGTGNLASTNPLWLGEVDRNQLENTFDKKDFLLPSTVEKMGNQYGELSLDNIVVPTLHYGLNGSNFGIAGSASIYSEADGSDVFTNSVSSKKTRSVNQWAIQCLKNSTGTTPSNYSSFKKGMIFRLDLGEGLEATSNSLGGALDSHSGTAAFSYLKDVKSFAVGDMSKSVKRDVEDHTAPAIVTENVDYSTHHNQSGGSDGEALHTGDLFQVAFVPSDGAINISSLQDNSTAGLIRFNYIGHLMGDVDEATHGNGTDDSTANVHDSERAYSGKPTYVYGHVNDDTYLYRLKTTSKKIDQLKANEVLNYDSNGNPVSMVQDIIEGIDLSEELNIDNFQIGTISECKSSDGEGSFGGGFGIECIFSKANRDFVGTTNWLNSGDSWNSISMSASSGATEGDFFTDTYLKAVSNTGGGEQNVTALDEDYFKNGMEAGVTYRLSYSVQVASHSSGSFDVGLGNDTATNISSDKKTYSADTAAKHDYIDFVYNATNHKKIKIISANSTDATIYLDNVSIREVSPNYYMGHGKLWVSNKNDYDKIYLIDTTNWNSIDADNSRLSYREVTLNFDRLHDNLFCFDDSTVGTGLVRLHGKQADSRLKDTVGEYLWDPEPSGQYISSICETYSHKPHLGDGATDGNSPGDGKWRVWVSYNKLNDSSHMRWDLFLFNFRPQGMYDTPNGGSSTGNDTQPGIGVNSNYEVYMYDKTPSYQECAYIKAGRTKNADTDDMYKMYYPIDKFHFARDKRYDSDGRVDEVAGYGSQNSEGQENFCSIGGKAERWHYNHYADSQNIVCFRNPSGEWVHWAVFYGSRYNSQSYALNLGYNSGWVAEPGSNGYRQWSNSRHNMKPHFKEWYNTGTTIKRTATELGSPVAHIVNLFGTLSGKFVTKGGELRAFKSGGDDVSWYAWKDSNTETYEEDFVMFTQHDSPVAFASLSGHTTNKEAQFNHGEQQGAPNDDDSNVTVAYNGSVTETIFNDTEAGWRTDKSVPATIGFSRFNQYRYKHDHNGVKELNKDNASISDMRAGYVNLGNDGYGGAYYGGDGFGHYNNVTTTWASNCEITRRGYYTENSDVENDRVFGQGFEMYENFTRKNGGEGVPEETEGFTGELARRVDVGSNGTTYSDANITDMTKTAFGTGYLTYRWPHKNDPAVNAANGGYGSTDAGYYPASGSLDINDDGTDGATNPSGNIWNNRKTVMCWNTTAISDSVYKNTDYSYSEYRSANEYEHLISPRCAMRKIVLPAGYIIKDIVGVDFISWQKIKHDGSSKRKHGYILNLRAESSPISDSDIESTILTVIDPKAINYNEKEGFGVRNSSNGNTVSWWGSQSKAAVSDIIPLIKQYKKDEENYFLQIASYTNNYVCFKNLNPGLSDSPVQYDNTHYFQRTFINAGNEDVMLDTYSPIVVGTTGELDEQAVSVWCRPQFSEQTSTTNGAIDNSTTYYPFYLYDRLWNFWSTDDQSPNNKSGYTGSFDVEAGFDRAVLKAGQTVSASKRLNEGYGSTAGVAMSVSSDDGIYPTSGSTTGYNDAENINTGVGSHSKKYKKQLLYKESEEPADTNSDGEKIGITFKEGDRISYKISYTYDGFQEGPLSDATFFEDITQDSKYIKLNLEVPSAAFLGLNPRVTDINIYRKINPNELYRLVESVSLDKKHNKFVPFTGGFRYKFKDERVTVSYEGLNGISETLDDLTPKYSLSCQLNDFLFVAKINHPEIPEGNHILLRSKQGKFSIFDWSNDFMDIPTQPVALVSFANRVFLFDENNTYIINPIEMVIEEMSEGIGILNNQSFVVTDIGLFFADRNNIYIHNGKEATPIGDPILYNHSRPEWQIGYLDALKKSEELGYTPRVVFDSIKQCLYVILQGYNDASEQNFNASYKANQSRLYSFNIQQKRWDYYSCPNVKSLALTGKGEVILNDGYQIYNYRVDKRNRKSFAWESKEFNMGLPDFEKSFKRLYVTGEVCLNTFNNDGVNAIAETGNNFGDWGNDLSYDVVNNYEVLDDTHELNTAPASESDDLKVYVDGVLQTMRVQNRKPHIGPYLANDKTNSIYTINTMLPAFETASNGLKNPAGADLLNAFSFVISSLPEFAEPPYSQYKKPTKQGELEELVHIHKGQYLYFSGTDENGKEYGEFVRVRNFYFDWLQTNEGENDISTYSSTHGTNGVRVSVFRGQLGTKAIDWHGMITDGTMTMQKVNPIRTAMPVLKFPAGTKGKSVKIVFKNQKSFIDSFAVTYRRKRIK